MSSAYNGRRALAAALLLITPHIVTAQNTRQNKLEAILNEVLNQNTGLYIDSLSREDKEKQINEALSGARDVALQRNIAKEQIERFVYLNPDLEGLSHNIYNATSIASYRHKRTEEGMQSKAQYSPSLVNNLLIGHLIGQRSKEFPGHVLFKTYLNSIFKGDCERLNALQQDLSSEEKQMEFDEAVKSFENKYDCTVVR